MLFRLQLFRFLVEQDLIVRRFQWIGNIHLVAIFEINQLVPFIIQQIMGYIKGKRHSILSTVLRLAPV